MADKNPKLSIVIATVDQATAKIKAINDRLDAVTKPTRDFKKALSDFGEKSGLDKVVSGFKGVGSAVEGVLTKLAVVGGIAGLAVHGLFGLVDEFDKLGDTAERVGVSVDFLASMRNAAERAGAPVEALDEGLTAFNQNIGQLRANTGRLYSFLEKVSPALLKQVKAAKSNEEAFNLMAMAIAKIPDPARRAALAQKAFGDSALAPLFAKGAKGIAELRAEYTKHAGSLEAAADAAGKTDDAMHVLHASLDGVKGALVAGLAPALTEIIGKLSLWFDGHRAQIAEWAKSIGEKLPAAVQKVVEWLGKAYDQVAAFVDMIGGLKGVAIAAGVVIAGPLVASLASLAASLVTVLARLTSVGGAMEAATAKSSGFRSALTGASGDLLGAFAIAEGLNQLTGGPLGADFMKRTGEYLHPKDVSAVSGGGGAGHIRNVAAGRPDIYPQAPQPVSQQSSSEAKVKIDIANLPPGSKVTADPKNTTDIDLSAGYQMFPGLM